jgi:recombination protein RecR
MEVIPQALAQLIDDLNRLPGVGKKTATRLALHILRRPESEAQSLARDLADLHSSIKLCSTCFAFSENDPCVICDDPRRNHSLICVVEGSADLIAIENTSAFSGGYHILHGALSPMDGVGPRELKIDSLVNRVKRDGVKEVLIGTSSTVPGEATAAHLVERLQNIVSVTRLACGIPMGMDIKYADEHTLARSIEARNAAGKVNI